MKIGFSTGCLHKTHDRLSPKTFDILRKIGCTAIELMWRSPEYILKLEQLNKDDLRGFEYVSIHFPKLDFNQIKQVKHLLSRIERVHERLSFDTVVLHPDEISNWSFIQTIALPIAIENMDTRKKSCKNVEDLQKVFQNINAKMIYDVAHVFDNDQTMKLGKDLVSAFSERICEIHVSGYNYRELHDPIHLSQQTQILDAIPSLDLPIIIESVCLNEEEVRKEFEYISNYLQNK
jgi:PII-like signaling protein